MRPRPIATKVPKKAPITKKFKGFLLSSIPSYERSRIAGVKKVNEFKDGFLILISILRLMIVRK